MAVKGLTTGFCNVEAKPLGPVHEYPMVVPGVVVEPLRVNEPPAHPPLLVAVALG